MIEGKSYPVTVFRDTGAQQSICRNVTGKSINTGQYVQCRGIHSEEYHDLVSVTIRCPLVETTAEVAVVDELPLKGVDFLLGSDLVGNRVFPPVLPSVVVSEKVQGGDSEDGYWQTDVFLACAVTRFLAKLAKEEEEESQESTGGKPGDGGVLLHPEVGHADPLACVGPDELRNAQQNDESLKKWFKRVGEPRRLEGGQEMFEVQNNILYRR